MRAFAACGDQTRPTIELHGAQLAIGPAGTDPHGTWGIHVEPPVDGRAQELREELETAARRLAGSKGNPPRLQDEVPLFDRKRTQYWAPGTPRDLPPQRRQVVPPRRTPVPGYYEPALAAPPSASPHIPSASKKPVGRRRKRGWTSPVPARPPAELAAAAKRSVGATTATGYMGGPVMPSRRGRGKANRPVAKLASRTLPPGLALADAERRVLTALGELGALTVKDIADLAGVDDGATWIDGFSARLGEHGVDLIQQGPERDGQPTYLLRR